MISSLQIEGYRGFRHFEAKDLGRVNLLVGTNNSGKTSVLEALYILMTQGNPNAFVEMLSRRGERMLVEQPSQRSDVQFDVSHLFTGHDLLRNPSIVLAARNQMSERVLTLSVREVDRQGELPLEIGGPPSGQLSLVMSGSPPPAVAAWPLSRLGGLAIETLDRRLRRVPDMDPALFITAESLDSNYLVRLWNKVALTPDEDLLLRALQSLDAGIERLAAQASPASVYYYSSGRAGFIVKLKDSEQPVPIGSLGDGIWRMLAMAVSITQCKGGVMLVDEIDTGLHHTVMADMWKLILRSARDFDVQVFATSHSQDCVRSLAETCSSADEECSVTIQRIEKGRRAAVSYTQAEIRAVAEWQMEVRG